MIEILMSDGTRLYVNEGKITGTDMVIVRLSRVVAEGYRYRASDPTYDDGIVSLLSEVIGDSIDDVNRRDEGEDFRSVKGPFVRF